MSTVNFDNAKWYRQKHDQHFDRFITTDDFKYFEAARAIAVQIIEYEKRHNSYCYSDDLEKMYFPRRTR
jgi:hypothetical protein